MLVAVFLGTQGVRTVRMLTLVLPLLQARENAITPCGKTTRRELGDRHFFFRPPSHPTCDDPSQVLPLIVLIHCYGCTAQMEIAKFADAADHHGFALAAPEGKHSSFNAPHCCGTARASNLPDVAFVDGIVTHLLSSWSPPRFSTSALFASGFSNGGFLTSYLAEASATQWTAIAPTAGHEYELRLQSRSPLPVFIHHCAADSSVNASGCCMLDGAPTCCCGIVARACVSTQSIFERWLQHNGCRGSKQASLAGVRGASCSIGVGCAAETTLCFHADGCYHAGWAREFPAAEEVLRFFGRQLCAKQQGAGGRNHGAAEATAVAESSADSSTTHPCRCSKGRAGPHCLRALAGAATGAADVEGFGRARRALALSAAWPGQWNGRRMGRQQNQNGRRSADSDTVVIPAT